MAALDWIKLSCDLPQKWQVLKLRRVLKLRTVDEVVGKLYRLWCHFENQSKGGRIKGLVPDDIDAICGKRGFAAAVVEVEWLRFDDKGAEIPAYDEYMGAASRARDAEAEKKRRQRDAAGNDLGDGRDNAHAEPGRDRDAAGTAGGTRPGQPGGHDRDGTGTSETETETEGKDNPPLPPAGGDAAAEAVAEKARLKAEAAAKKAELADGFAAFWAAYPKKQSKPDAEKAFAKLSPSPELLRAILEAVARQKTWHGWLKDNGQFIPHPATWLNAKRWADEPPAPAGPPPPKPPPFRTARQHDDEFAAQMFADAFTPEELP